MLRGIRAVQAGISWPARQNGNVFLGCDALRVFPLLKVGVINSSQQGINRRYATLFPEQIMTMISLYS